MTASTTLIAIFVTLLGLAFGSFANVVVWRLPRGEALDAPPSHCPACETPIAWYDNIPVLSWVLLRGRCRSCGAPISARYPIVELLGGLAWLLAYLRFGMSLRLPFALALFWLLLVLGAIDRDCGRLPNSLIGVMAAIGAVGCAISALWNVLALPLITFTGVLAPPLVAAVAGVVAGAGLALVVSLAYQLIRKTPGMGMGDVKLLAALGLFTGVYSLMVLFVAAFVGGAYALVTWRQGGGRRKFAFGPFLAGGAVFVVLFGPILWALYRMATGI